MSWEEGLIVNSSASADAVIMDIEAAVAAAAACSTMENHNNMLQEEQEEEEEHNIDLLHDDSCTTTFGVVFHIFPIDFPHCCHAFDHSYHGLYVTKL